MQRCVPRVELHGRGYCGRLTQLLVAVHRPDKGALLSPPMLRLTTLGALDLRDASGQAVREILAQPKRVALLVYLCVQGARGPVSRERLLAMFWPELDDTRARNALSQALYHLRQSLGPHAIEGHGATTLEVSSGAVTCDANELTAALAAGECELALELSRGEFCPSLVLSAAPDFEEWASGVSRDLRRRLFDLARRDVCRLMESGDTRSAAHLAGRALAQAPDDEREVRDFLRALDLAGDGTGALHAYAAYAARIRSTLDVELTAETQRLAEEIRRRAAQAIVPHSPPTEALTGAEASHAAATLMTNALSPGVDARVDRLSVARPDVGDFGRRRGRPRRRKFAALAVSALLIASAAAAIRSHARQAPSDTQPDGFAVFPFSVRGGEPVAFLRDGMPHLLAAKFDGTPELRAIDPRSSVAAARGLAPDPVSAEVLARALGARYFVLGDVMQAAGGIEVDGSLYEVGKASRPLVTASVHGDTAALFGVVDDLARRLMAGALDGRDTTLTRLAAVTTSSLPALKAYLRGERLLRAGLDARAAEAFGEAARIDTAFALAQYRLAVTSTWASISPDIDPVQSAASAERHDAQLTPMARDLLAAYHAYRTQEPRTERMYRSITQLHPDNVEAWFMLGETLFHYAPLFGRSPSASRAAFDRVLSLDASNSHAMLHLARLDAIEGHPDSLRAMTARYTAQFDTLPRAVELRALRAWLDDDVRGATDALRAADESDDLLMLSLALAAGTYAVEPNSERTILQRLIITAERPNVTRTAALMLIDADIAQGRWSGRARRATPEPAADRAWRLEGESLVAAEPVFGASRALIAALRDSITILSDYPALGLPNIAPPDVAGVAMRQHLLGLLSLRLDDTVAARQHLSALEAMATRTDGHYAATLSTVLHAEMERGAGQWSRALATLDATPVDISLRRLAHGGIRERFAHGELLVSLGRDGDAQQWFETFVTYFDTPFVAAAQLRLGQIHERAGRRNRAALCYHRALALWHGADADFAPLVREAQAGMERVQRGGTAPQS